MRQSGENAYENRKIKLLIKDIFKPWIDDNGITYISLKDFLTNENLLDL